jgi:nucleotide-binding universal stress UspA family protein
MHVLEDYSNLEERPGPIEDGVRRLQAMVLKDAALAYVPEIVMEFGSPWQCIVNKGGECDADLIVSGAHPADGTSHLAWSTVHQVAAHASCPVLTVPA